MLGFPDGMADLYLRAWVYIARPASGATTDLGRALFDIKHDVTGGVGVNNWTVDVGGRDGGVTNHASGSLLAFELDHTTLHQGLFYYDAQTPMWVGSSPPGTAMQVNDLRISYDEWHCIETLARCNTATGANDGQWTAWFDGQLKIDVTGADGCGPWPTAGMGQYNSLRIGNGADGVSAMIDELRFFDSVELYI